MSDYTWKLFKNGQLTDMPAIRSETRMREILGQLRSFATQMDYTLEEVNCDFPNEVGFAQIDKNGERTELVFRKQFATAIREAARPAKKK